MSLPAKLDLTAIQFRASIDFVTITTPGKRELPPLQGRPKWGKAANYLRLTIHDPQPVDVRKLVVAFPDAQIVELEIAVDVSPTHYNDLADRCYRIDQCFSYVANHLYPYQASGMGNVKTVGYIPEIQEVRPFNYRSPNPTEELLYGLRNDQPVQVKVYRKGRDQGMDWHSRRRFVRTEVTLKQAMCKEFGLVKLADLQGFSFRKTLSPYFRMAREAEAKPRRSAQRFMQIVHAWQAKHRQQQADCAWSANGVQGARIIGGLRFRRNVRVNQRIGKALYRLEESFSREKIVLESPAYRKKSSFTTASYAIPKVLPITTNKEHTPPTLPQ